MRSIAKFLLLAGMSAALATPAFALSLGSYSIVEGSRQSIGGLSTSVTTLSNASSTATGVAQGDYTLVEVVAMADRPDMVRLALANVDREQSSSDVYVYLPAQTYLDAGLQAGNIITAKQRSYGIELARATDNKTFFLIVDDHVLNELKSTPVEG
nr:hypothetical protein [uncultured Rhodoferax sp.]